MKTIEHFVNGKKYPGKSKKTGKVYNPATGEQSAEVRLGNKDDLNKAVEVAKKAFLTASFKSFVLPKLTLPDSSPVAGLKIVEYLLESPEYFLPLMKCSISFIAFD